MKSSHQKKKAKTLIPRMWGQLHGTKKIIVRDHKKFTKSTSRKIQYSEFTEDSSIRYQQRKSICLNIEPLLQQYIVARHEEHKRIKKR